MHLKVPLHNLSAGHRLGDATATAARPQHAAVLATLYRLHGVINDVSQFRSTVHLEREGARGVNCKLNRQKKETPQDSPDEHFRNNKINLLSSTTSPWAGCQSELYPGSAPPPHSFPSGSASCWRVTCCCASNCKRRERESV